MFIIGGCGRPSSMYGSIPVTQLKEAGDCRTYWGMVALVGARTTRCVRHPLTITVYCGCMVGF